MFRHKQKKANTAYKLFIKNYSILSRQKIKKLNQNQLGAKPTEIFFIFLRIGTSK